MVFASEAIKPEITKTKNMKTIYQKFETLGDAGAQFVETEIQAEAIRNQMINEIAQMIYDYMGAPEELDEMRSNRTGCTHELDVWDAAYDMVGAGNPLTLAAARFVAESAVVIEEVVE